MKLNRLSDISSDVQYGTLLCVSMTRQVYGLNEDGVLMGSATHWWLSLRINDTRGNTLSTAKVLF